MKRSVFGHQTDLAVGKIKPGTSTTIFLRVFSKKFNIFWSMDIFLNIFFLGGGGGGGSLQNLVIFNGVCFKN